MLPNRITSREAYYKVRRPGRGVALDRAKRAAVWDVIEAYRAQARIAGSVDFPEAATIAAVHLRRVADTSGEYVADHVLVDEGQDLGPAHWQLLRALVGEHADDLFIAEDSHQRIYGQRVVLSQFGIRIVGRSQRLTLNYRTTAQNLGYAINVLEGGAYVDLESGQESTAGYRSARSGPVPRLIPCATLTEELDRAADLIRTWVAETDAPETIAVLVREQRQRDRLVSGLAERGVTIRAVDREHIKPGQPVAMTMHRAKGTEFSKVLLFGVDQGAIPRPLRDEQYAEDAWADALLRERSLLYVAATRARDELALSWSGDPSQLLPPAAEQDSAMIRGPLTAELDSKDSPVRRFLDDRFTSGLRDVQRRYRQAAQPSSCLPRTGRKPTQEPSGRRPTGSCGSCCTPGRPSRSQPRARPCADAVPAVVEAFIEIAESLGYDPDAVLDMSATDFTGPIGGNDADPGQLASACWALALLTEMFRNPMVAMRGPLERFQGHRASASELLGLASPAALGQLAAFREVFASTLLPQLAHRPGRWVLGAEFTGSALIKADADVIAAGLLLDLKTDSKLSLGVTTMFQVIGYALLDFDDAYQLTEVGTFSARYAYLATWDIGTLFDELAGHHVSLPFIRQEFRQLLLAHQLSVNESLLQILQSGFVTGQVRSAVYWAMHSHPANKPTGSALTWIEPAHEPVDSRGTDSK